MKIQLWFKNSYSTVSKNVEKIIDIYEHIFKELY